MQRITHPACASCKHQRKRCTEDCVLAPYFPADKSREFQAVHKVFGVSNVQKIVLNVKEDDRKKVSDSLVWEAFCRQKDPVLGPYGEYKRICEELNMYKSQKQVVQLPTSQGGAIMYKTTPAMIGWNRSNVINHKGMTTIEGGILNNNNNNNNNVLHINHENENSIVDFNVYGFPSHYVQSLEKSKLERDVGSVVVPLQQQHPVNEFNQCYFSGQFSKTSETTI